MIVNFDPHAANECTLLAWVRTAVAFIARTFVLSTTYTIPASEIAAGHRA